MTKLKTLYENRLDELTRNNEKKENISDFQKKYLQEMEDLQMCWKSSHYGKRPHGRSISGTSGFPIERQ